MHEDEACGIQAGLVWESCNPPRSKEWLDHQAVSLSRMGRSSLASLAATSAAFFRLQSSLKP